MKSELLKTTLFVAAALILAASANWVEPVAVRPEILSDEGELLFPEFRDVMDVKAIEVIDYNEDQAVAQPLKVEFTGNRWVLPSHNNYPAEAADRLDKTAGALLDVKKDLVVSDLIEDHAAYGVIDPLDTEVASLAGRGKRVTLRNGQDDVLADMILGKPVPDKQGFRYIRLPNHKRTYGVKTEADPSARFQDWVDGNLLRLAGSRLRKVTINSYSIDETFGRLANVQKVVLTKSGSKWTSGGTRKVSSSDTDRAVAALSAIRVVGARPKPKPLAEQLRTGQLAMTLEAVMSFRQRGFYLTQQGQLLANEGEVIAETNRGLVYTLRFGEIVTGTAGATEGKTESNDTGEQDRYLLVMVNYSPQVAASYGDTSGRGESIAKSLNRRFADWYYVISGEDFARLRIKK